MRTLLVITFAMLSAECILAQGTLLAEPFNDNKQSWPFMGRGDGYSITLEEGHLIMNGNSTAIQTFQKVAVHAEMDFAVYGRFIFLNGDHTGWMGIRFMMNEDADRYCTFAFNNDKGFLISERNGKKYAVLRESKSQVVLPYDYNTLTVVKRGSVYRFLINDKQVHEVKIKSFYGPQVGVMTNANMAMKVDEFQVYNPEEGRKKLSGSDRLAMVSASTLPATAVGKSIPPAFQNLLDQFAVVSFPYYFKPENAQGVDVSHLPIVQENFYKYVSSNVRDKGMWAMCRLSECADGHALLMMNRYLINNQDVSRFFVAIFDANGELKQEKEIGAMVKEGNEFFKIIEFKAYRDINVMNIEATETFHNGNKNKSSVRYNTVMCN